MTSKERVLTALDHKTPDRTPCDYLGTPEVDEMLKAHFDTNDIDIALEKLGVDLRVVVLEQEGYHLLLKSENALCYKISCPWRPYPYPFRHHLRLVNHFLIVLALPGHFERTR